MFKWIFIAIGIGIVFVIIKTLVEEAQKKAEEKRYQEDLNYKLDAIRKKDTQDLLKGYVDTYMKYQNTSNKLCKINLSYLNLPTNSPAWKNSSKDTDYLRKETESLEKQVKLYQERLKREKVTNDLGLVYSTYEDDKTIAKLQGYNIMSTEQAIQELQKISNNMKANAPKPRPQKEKSVIGQAVAGGIIAGPAGAVVGAVHAADKNSKIRAEQASKK